MAESGTGPRHGADGTDWRAAAEAALGELRSSGEIEYSTHVDLDIEGIVGTLPGKKVRDGRTRSSLKGWLFACPSAGEGAPERSIFTWERGVVFEVEAVAGRGSARMVGRTHLESEVPHPYPDFEAWLFHCSATAIRSLLDSWSSDAAFRAFGAQ